MSLGWESGVQEVSFQAKLTVDSQEGCGRQWGSVRHVNIPAGDSK